MAKRFTDSDKWKRPWFRSLPIKAKVVWQYLCDECNHAGIWTADFELLSFQVGFQVTPGDLKDWLGSKLVIIDHDKYFIPYFFEVQYGETKDEFSAKKSALRLLSQYGLVTEAGDLIALTDSYLSVLESNGTVVGESLDSTSIGIGKSKSKKKGGVGENKIPGHAECDFTEIYKLYPLKKGKEKGLAICRSTITTPEDFERLKQAITRYREECIREKKEPRFIKHFSTFMASWRDYLDPDAGTAPDIPPPGSDSVSDIEAWKKRVMAESEENKRREKEMEALYGSKPS